MKTEARQPGWLPDGFLAEVRRRLENGRRVRRTLPDGGRLHIDRQLPFLCVFRQPDQPTVPRRAPPEGWSKSVRGTSSHDPGTRQLVKGEASFLVATAAKQAGASLSTLVRQLAELMSDRFGGFLIVEIWSGPDQEVAAAFGADDVAPTEFQPDFVLSARPPDVPRKTVEVLKKHLGRISVLKQKATVRFDPDAPAHPPGLGYLLKAREASRLGCATIGIQVRPIYRDHESGELFPSVLRSLRRGVGRALKQAFFTFAKTRTNVRPEHYYALGRRALVKAVWEVDRRLSEVGDSFDFLLQVTPVNAEAAWREFRRGRFESTPRFYYRPLAVEPAVLKRRLFEVPIENIEDPTLGELFRQRQDELDRKITMLSDIGTPRFLLGSRQVYGGVEDELLTVATDLLSRLPSRSREDSAGGMISADQFAKRAEAEIAHYRKRLPAFSARAVVRQDLFAGLLCSSGHLLIGHQTRIPANRVDALLQHEVGTHLLTYYNGLAEPFQQLHSGFAGYEALQEGLAVLTEYLVGGLSVPRMRLLAARVVAAKLLTDGASFIDTFRKLDVDYDFAQRIAYTITMRVYRGGGLTKDAIYLRGLGEILAYLRKGGPLEPLYIGKIAAEHIPLIRELCHRKVLKPPALLPRYLELPGVAERLEGLRNGVAVPDLVKGSRV